MVKFGFLSRVVRPIRPALKWFCSNKRDQRVVPKFWTGTPAMNPELFVINCENYNLTQGPDKLPELTNQILNQFNEKGLVWLRNTRLQNVSTMKDWAKIPMDSDMRYEGGANMRDELFPNVYDVGAPKEAWLHYHHEMAYVNQSVSILAFCAIHTLPPETDDPLRGATFVSDNMAVTKDILNTDFGQKLKQKGISYIRCLTDRNEGTHCGIYNHWQKSFEVETIEEVEKLAIQKGLQKTDWGPNRYFKTKYTVSAFEYYPKFDTNVLYSSIADHSSWFDQWPGVKDLPEMKSFETAVKEERPLKITFGTGEDMSFNEIKQFADIYDKHGIPIKVSTGDVVIICNYRFAHGRPPFAPKINEKREFGVILGPMFDRIGDKEGKWMF